MLELLVYRDRSEWRRLLTYQQMHCRVKECGIFVDLASQLVMFGCSTFAGFAFVTFEREETVDKVVEIHYHDINNKTVC